MLDIETVKLIFDVVSATVSVLFLTFKFLDWFVDYKLNQRLDWEFKNTKKNRCSSHKGKQR